VCNRNIENSKGLYYSFKGEYNNADLSFVLAENHAMKAEDPVGMDAVKIYAAFSQYLRGENKKSLNIAGDLLKRWADKPESFHSVHRIMLQEIYEHFKNDDVR
jgi:hypothetical protein